MQALESDDYSVMPSAAQGRGFLRNYAEYLELNIDEMIAEIQKNAPQAEVISGPLPQVNLAETEIPPLPSELDEKPARPSRASRLGRRPKGDLASEAESTKSMQEEIPAPAVPEVEVKQPKPRGRKKKPVVEEVVEIKAGELSLPVEQDQVHSEQGRRVEVIAEREAQPGLISKLMTSFQSVFVKKESQQEPELPAVVEPEILRSVPLQPADVIFAEIGAQLRERRELISLTLDEVERHTKLRVQFVKALEEGAFDQLPSPVQTRGMLANYATFLDLDTDAILLRFADGLQARRYEKYAETPREKIQTEVITSMPFLRGFIAGDLIFGVVMIAILFALAIWGVGRVVNSQNEQNAEATALPIVDVLGNTPLPTASLEMTFVPVDENSPVTPGAEVPADSGIKCECGCQYLCCRACLCTNFGGWGSGI